MQSHHRPPLQTFHTRTHPATQSCIPPSTATTVSIPKNQIKSTKTMSHSNKALTAVFVDGHSGTNPNNIDIHREVFKIHSALRGNPVPITTSSVQVNTIILPVLNVTSVLASTLIRWYHWPPGTHFRMTGACDGDQGSCCDDVRGSSSS